MEATAPELNAKASASTPSEKMTPFSGIGLQGLGRLGHRLDRQDGEAQELHAQRRQGRGGLQGRLHALGDQVGLDEAGAQGPGLLLGSRRRLGRVRDTLRQLVGVVGAVGARGVHAVVEQLRQPGGLGHAVGQAALDGHGLEVGGGLVEDERHVGAADGHGQDRGRRAEVEERQSHALALDPAVDVLQDVRRRRGLEVADAEH
jgi:hypothetical protein